MLDGGGTRSFRDVIRARHVKPRGPRDRDAITEERKGGDEKTSLDERGRGGKGARWVQVNAQRGEDREGTWKLGRDQSRDEGDREAEGKTRGKEGGVRHVGREEWKRIRDEE